MTLVVMPEECQSHSHHRAERLEPERMRQPLQEFIAAVVMDDGLANDGAKRRHPFGQPRRNTAAVKRKIGAAGTSGHACSIRVDDLRGLAHSKDSLRANARTSVVVVIAGLDPRLSGLGLA
jgi:hypothetical protein